MITSFQDLIDEAIAAEQDPNRKRSGKFNPSSLGKCHRAQIWNRMNKPVTDPPDKRTLRVFKVGNVFHACAQDMFIKINPNLQKEVKVEDDDFLGFCDLVDIDECSDIKTVHSRAFFHMEKSKNIKEDKKTNFLQCSFYSYKLKKDWVRIIFIEKDALCVTEYRFPLTDFIDELMDEVSMLKSYWESKVIPPAKPRAYGGKECQYCNWRTACKKEEEDVAKREEELSKG